MSSTLGYIRHHGASSHRTCGAVLRVDVWREAVHYAIVYGNEPRMHALSLRGITAEPGRGGHELLVTIRMPLPPRFIMRTIIPIQCVVGVRGPMRFPNTQNPRREYVQELRTSILAG